MSAPTDREKNRFSARAKRYANVGTKVGGVAARMAGARLLGVPQDRAANALGLAAALGGLKGPIMKVAQLLATIPDALPAEYAAELTKLQSQAPPMGWAFVKRRMSAELGADWESKFKSFEHHPAAAASLGQVHRARALDGAELACKLQYPDMQSAVEADVRQLKWLFAIRKRFDPALDTTEIAKEIAARLREELDYIREAKHVALYRNMLKGNDTIRVPEVWPELSTGRLLTMDWMSGRKLLEHKDDPLAVRNRLATAMFTAWWFPFSRFGVIHGDPHLGNYTVFDNAKGKPAGINLLDYGCIRIFPESFVGGVVDLYRGLLESDDDLVVHAYETWGFKRPQPRADRGAQYLGTLHLRPLARRPGAQHCRRGQAVGIRPQGSVPGPPGVEKARTGDGSARIRIHGPRGHRPRRGIFAFGGGTQFLSIVQRGDRAFLDSPGGCAASRRAERGRPEAFRRLTERS